MSFKDNWLERQITTVQELLANGTELAQNNNIVQATARFKEAAVIIESAESVDHRVLQLRSNVYNELGLIASRTRDPANAIRYHRLTLDARKQLNDVVDTDLAPAIAASHLNVGSILASLGQFEDAEQDLRSALDLLKDADSDDDSIKMMRLGGYQNLGISLVSRKEFDEGLDILKKAAQVGTDLTESGHLQLRPALAQILMNTAVAQHACEHFEDAVHTGNRASELTLKLHEEDDDDNQTMLQQFVACQMNLITFNESANLFDKAEDALFKVLDLLPGHPDILRRGLAFYESILEKSDDELEDGGLPREEAEESQEELQEMANKVKPING